MDEKDREIAALRELVQDVIEALADLVAVCDQVPLPASVREVVDAAREHVPADWRKGGRQR